MHSGLALRGWFVWLVYGVTIVLLGGAVGVIVSALRRPATDFGRLGRAPWVALQAAFLALSAFALSASLLDFADALPPWLASVLGAVVLAAAIQQVAYLLRVVYPSPGRQVWPEVEPPEESH